MPLIEADAHLQCKGTLKRVYDPEDIVNDGVLAYYHCVEMFDGSHPTGDFVHYFSRTLANARKNRFRWASHHLNTTDQVVEAVVEEKERLPWAQRLQFRKPLNDDGNRLLQCILSPSNALALEISQSGRRHLDVSIRRWLGWDCVHWNEVCADLRANIIGEFSVPGCIGEGGEEMENAPTTAGFPRNVHFDSNRTWELKRATRKRLVQEFRERFPDRDVRRLSRSVLYYAIVYFEQARDYAAAERPMMPVLAKRCECALSAVRPGQLIAGGVASKEGILMAEGEKVAQAGQVPCPGMGKHWDPDAKECQECREYVRPEYDKCKEICLARKAGVPKVKEEGEVDHVVNAEGVPEPVVDRVATPDTPTDVEKAPVVPQEAVAAPEVPQEGVVTPEVASKEAVAAGVAAVVVKKPRKKAKAKVARKESKLAILARLLRDGRSGTLQQFIDWVNEVNPGRSAKTSIILVRDRLNFAVDIGAVTKDKNGVYSLYVDVGPPVSGN